MLEVFEVSLRSIFTQYAKGAGAIGDEMDDVKLMSYQEFKQLVRDLQLCEADFTAREVDLAFIWSRMRIVDAGRRVPGCTGRCLAAGPTPG